MEQLPGYKDRTNHIYRLHHPFYGLKQSSVIWNKKLNSEFISLGFTQLIVDQCVYIQWNTDSCHDLAKWLSQYLFFFYFSFLLFSDYYFSFYFHFFIFLLMDA